jgi:predicted GNAT family N-acyltransferase
LNKRTNTLIQAPDLRLCHALFGDELYAKSVDLRYELMRKPLGLTFTDEELRQDVQQHHLVAVLGEDVVGVMIYYPETEKEMRVRQFCVRSDLQGKGIGRLMIHYAEACFRLLSFTSYYGHARLHVSSMYESWGMTKEGEIFTEVGIPHIKMSKKL